MRRGATFVHTEAAGSCSNDTNAEKQQQQQQQPTCRCTQMQLKENNKSLSCFKKNHTVCLFRLAVIGVDRSEISQRKLAFLILGFPNLPEQDKLYREHLVWKAFSLRINTASNIFFYYNTVVTKHTLASRGLSGKHQCSQGLRNWFPCLCRGGLPKWYNIL